MSAYRVVCADPPWPFRDKLPGYSRGAVRNYRLMPMHAIADYLPTSHLPVAGDAWLFLWRVASQVQEAYVVATMWGFTPKSEIVWLKKTTSGKDWFGMGRSVRMAHEVCIIATRGHVKAAARNIRSTFSAPVGKHSEKPEAFYDLVEKLTGGGPYLELFARRQRPGWACIGDELVNNNGQRKDKHGPETESEVGSLGN